MRGFEDIGSKGNFLANKRAMLRSLGGGQIEKTHKNSSGQSQSFKNNNFPRDNTTKK